MFFSKKGDMTWHYMIGALLAVITLILMIFFVKNILFIEYDSSVMECNFFMSNVNGAPTYFGDGTNEITHKFLGTVASICPMKNVEVDEDNLNDLAKLMGSCYKAMGSGNDFFGANVENKSICMECGFMNVDENVDKFNSKFSKVLEDDRFKSLWDDDNELINGNPITLNISSLSDSVFEGDTYMVVYYAFRPESGNFFDSISAFFGNHVSASASYLFSSNNGGGVSGIFLAEWDENVEFKTNKSVSFQSSGVSINCDNVITPEDFS